MPKYSKDLTTYPSVLYDYLRGEPQEAMIEFDSEKEARNFQFRFWGLRAALRDAVAERKLATIADQARIAHRAERTECTRSGPRVTFTPKELLTQTANLRIVYGRKVDPSIPATEGDRLAREGEAKLLAMLSAPQPQASAPDYAQAAGQSLPTKTLAQVLEEQALRDDDD